MVFNDGIKDREMTLIHKKSSWEYLSPFTSSYPTLSLRTKTQHLDWLTCTRSTFFFFFLLNLTSTFIYPFSGWKQVPKTKKARVHEFPAYYNCSLIVSWKCAWGWMKQDGNSICLKEMWKRKKFINWEFRKQEMFLCEESQNPVGLVIQHVPILSF